MAKRTPEQNHAIYERRVARARIEGFSGYSEKRREAERERESEQSFLDELRNIIGDSGGDDFDVNDIVNVGDVAVDFSDREDAYERLVESGKFSEEELEDLYDLIYEGDFWETARPMFDRVSPGGGE